MSDPLVLVAVQRTYRSEAGDLPILLGADLTLRAGEIVALVAPSGAGKSTLLHVAGLLDRPDAGSVMVGGVDAGSLPDSGRTAVRRDTIGFVYQFHHLLGEFTAQENVAMPLIIAGLPYADCLKRAAALLGRVGLAERLTHRPAQLSGGERQRVAIARALVNNPACVLMDEPTGNLDRATAHTIHELIRELNAQLHISFVLVTHDTNLAAQMNRTLVLQDGKLVLYQGHTDA